MLAASFKRLFMKKWFCVELKAAFDGMSWLFVCSLVRAVHYVSLKMWGWAARKTA